MTASEPTERAEAQDNQADDALKRDMPLVPASSIAGRALVIVIAIMTFLACLTAGGAILVASASQDWRGEISREVTIQIKPAGGEDIEAQVAKASETARKAPGVLDVRALSKQESEQLLEPWLGNGLDLGELPIPRLIVVRMRDRTAPDISALREALAAQAPGASLSGVNLSLGGPLIGLPAGASLSDPATAASLADQLGAAIDNVGQAVSQLSAQGDSIQTNLALVAQAGLSSSAGVDPTLDGDSARLTALSVQQQLAVSGDSIGNQAPQSILALFR